MVASIVSDKNTELKVIEKSYLSYFYRQGLNSLSFKNLTLSLQHLSAINRFLKSDSEYCLILEDDTVVVRDNLELSIDETFQKIKRLKKVFLM